MQALRLTIKPGGAAERAGLQTGDILVTYNGVAVGDSGALGAAIQAAANQAEPVAVQGESIKPDDDTRSLARAASRNGKVEVRGRDGTGKKVFKSTAQHPMVEAVPFDPNIETVSDVLQRMAAESKAGAK